MSLNLVTMILIVFEKETHSLDRPILNNVCSFTLLKDIEGLFKKIKNNCNMLFIYSIQPKSFKFTFILLVIHKNVYQYSVWKFSFDLCRTGCIPSCVTN